jgi:hypothetical protein
MLLLIAPCGAHNRSFGSGDCIELPKEDLHV